MKTFAAFLLLAVSINAHSASISLGTVLLTAGDDFKVSETILNDSQNYLQTGHLSLMLAEKIGQIQSENSEISVEEAIDLLIEQNL